MPDRSGNTKRLAKNTLMLYFRMLFNLVVALFTSRMILAALGETDYGVYNVVGGVVSMFSILTSSLSSAISRFQTYEMGKGESGRLQDVFTVSMWIQILFSGIAFLLIETIGVWFLNTHMTIPVERIGAANWILQFSAFTFVSSVTVTPYSASVVSHEEMGVFAWISIYDTIFKFLVALLLFYIVKQFDKLILYAGLLALSTLSVQVVYRIYCRRHYAECRMKKGADRQIAKEIFSFAGWNFVGHGATLLSGQGVSIVLNMVFGPAVNAARGLATTVSNIVANFANNFNLALNPQIVKSYAQSDKSYTEYLVQRGARFAFYIFYILALPVLLEADFLMDFWLKDVPQHTVNFVRLTIGVMMIDLLSTTLKVLITATGRIKNFTLARIFLGVVYLGACYLFIRTGAFNPEVVYTISVVTTIIGGIIRMYYSKKIVGISIYGYLKNVVLNICLVVLSSGVVPVVCLFAFENDGWLRFFFITFISVLCSGASAFFIGCDKSERTFIITNIKKILVRFLPSGS